MTYITVPTETDPDVLAADAISYLQAQIPGWVPDDNSLVVMAITSWARQLATSRDVASIVPDIIFQNYGSSIMNIPPISAVSAQVSATLTMQDNAGYTIPTGTQFGFQVSGSTVVVFETTAPVVIPPGSTTALGVQLTALDPGAAGNGFTGAMQVVTSIAYITSAVATTVSAGGTDAETATEYMGRLVAQLQLMAPRPIKPQDFATMARSVAGVFRAIGIDGYNPGDATFGNERMVAVSAVDEAGNAVPLAVQTAMIALLESEREINFIVNWVAPTYTNVAVNYTVHLESGAVWADVETAINNALTAYLSQATWGGGGQSPPTWDPSANVVRYFQVAGVIENVPGVDYIQAGTLTLNGVAADLALPGVAPLANVGVLTGAQV